MVERNLGFEAEHHQSALVGVLMTLHSVDHAAQRYSILTTQDIKLSSRSTRSSSRARPTPSASSAWR